MPEYILTSCGHTGHEFLAMPNHPRTGDDYDCPHCMKSQLIQFESYVDFMSDKED